MAAAVTHVGPDRWRGGWCKAPLQLITEPGEAIVGGCSERPMRASPLGLGSKAWYGWISICLPRALIMGLHQESEAELPKSEMEETCPPSPPVMIFHTCPSHLKLQARSTAAF